jgi:hypothetical protein
MFERIAIVITAITFIGSLLFGFAVSILDLIWVMRTSHSLTGINTVTVLVIVILAAPVSLGLIYLGQGLDHIFKTKRG